MTNKKLKLIKHGDVLGYTISDIKEVLSPKKFAEFERWMRGQTVGIYKREDLFQRKALLIYRYNFERFLEGLPVLD